MHHPFPDITMLGSHIKSSCYFLRTHKLKKKWASWMFLKLPLTCSSTPPLPPRHEEFTLGQVIHRIPILKIFLHNGPAYAACPGDPGQVIQRF